MTVQAEFHSYQSAPLQPDPQRCSPLSTEIVRYLLGRWGGANLGCYVDRPIRGGSSPSTHGSGAACDWRYADPGPGRSTMLAEVLPLLIDSSAELGIQAIHDYAGDRIWRPPAYRGGGDGWRKQFGSGGQMGASWATWIHVEVHPSRWDDARSVATLIGAAEPSTENPRFDPASGEWGDWPRRRPTPHLAEGDRGDAIALVQGVAHLRLPSFCHWFGTVAAHRSEDAERKRWRTHHRQVGQRLFRARDLCQDLDVDGEFGSRTAECVVAVKKAFNGRKHGGQRYELSDVPDVGGGMWRLVYNVANGHW